MENIFHPQWLNRMRQIIPQDEWETFLKSARSPLPKTVRITENVELPEGYSFSEVAEIPEARFIHFEGYRNQKNKNGTSKKCCNSRREDKSKTNRTQPPYDESLLGSQQRSTHFTEVPIGKTLGHFTGRMYAASLSSLLSVHILDPHPNEKIIDMCAAPGSKTTFIAQRMKNTGALIANELKASRIPSLRQNLDRMGIQNTIVVQGDGNNLPDTFTEEFDRILLDAPCSGDSFGRKDPKFFKSTWKEHHILPLANLQKDLIVSAFEMLKLKGEMVYSTCTAAPEENEAVIQYLCEQYPDEVEIRPVDLGNIPFRRGITHFNGEKICSEKIASSVCRLLPHLTTDTWDSEFFFIAKIRKKELIQRPFVKPFCPPSPYETLKKNSKAEIFARYRKTYGIANTHYEKKAIIERNNDRFLTTPDLPYFLKRIKAAHVGLKMSNKEKGITTQFAQHFGRFASKNVYTLNDEESIKFLHGYDIRLPEPLFEHGTEVIMMHNNIALGHAKSVKNILKNKLGKNEILR